MLNKLFWALLLIESLLFPATNASAFSPQETQITQYIAQQKSAQLSLLEKLVNINSGTTNIPGVHQIGEILQAQFNELGFTTRWAEEPSTLHRAGTLIAEHKGTAGKRILLIGHLDTVFPKESSFQKFTLNGKIATGPGVIDIKGGDVIILFALKALQVTGALQNATITVVLTGDEEDSGKPTAISRKPLIDLATHIDVALDFEESITADTATIARRGISYWMLDTQGNEAHSSGIFQNYAGFGAIFEMTRILNTMRTQLSDEKYLSFSPGLILGGTVVNFDKNSSQGSVFGKGNVIAKQAMAKGDLRFLSMEQKLNAEKHITAIVQHNLPGTTASMHYQDSIPAMPPTANNLALLKIYSDASLELGFGPVKPLDPGKRGAGDISHIAAFVPANLAGLGALGSGPHSAKEQLKVSSLVMQTERAALLIYRLTQAKRAGSS